MKGLEMIRRRMTPVEPGHYLIGLSGGADSTCMTLALMPDIRDGRIHAEAVHVNHGIRGEDAEKDAAFSEDLCRRLRIPFHLYRIDMKGRTDENSARDGRYGSYRECLLKTGAQAVLLAHHADDLAETVLMRLIRGTGPEGLCGIMPEADVMGVHVIRPMLKIRREEIRRAMEEAGEGWREDTSNLNSNYLRNAIRNEILPRLEALSPGAGSRIAVTAMMAGRENRYLQQKTALLLKEQGGPGWLNAEAVKALPAPLQYRVLRMWYRDNSPQRKQRGLTAEQTEQLAALLKEPRGSVNLPGGLKAYSGCGKLILTGFSENRLTEVPWHGPETEYGSFTLRENPNGSFPGDGRRTQAVPEGFAAGCVIRTRRPGDRICPFGSSGSRKLQDYLTDRKIPAPWRDRIPLLCRGDEVLFAGGVGAGAVPRCEKAAGTVTLEWYGDMPWTENNTSA